MLEPVRLFRDWLQEPKVRRRTLLGGVAAAASLGGGAMLAAERYLDREREWETLPPEGRLTILSGQDESAGEQREALVRQWNELHPHHRAVWKRLPSNTDLQYNGIHTALQSHDSRFDLVNLDIPWITEFAGHGYLRRLDGIRDAGFLEAPFRSGLVEGEVYALPFNTDVGLLYYNKDVVPDADPFEWSWDEFVEKVRGILEGEDTTAPRVEAGIAMQLDRYEGFTANVWEVLLSQGAEPGGEDPDRFEIGAATVRAVEELRGLIDEGVILEESLAFDEAASLEAFKQGRTVFLRHWPNAYRQLVACGAVDFEVGIAPLPGVGVLGGQSLAVTSASRYPVVAQALAEFLTSARSQQLLFERGGFAPTRHEPYADAYLRGAPSPDETPEESATPAETPSDASADPDPPSVEDDAPCVDSEEMMGFPLAGVSALETGLSRAGQRPAVDRYNRFSEVFRDHVHSALSGGEFDGEALQRELEDAVEGKG